MEIRFRHWATVLRRMVLLVAVVLCVAVNILRFFHLDTSPPGFHVDELSGAVTIQCLDQEGVDAVGTPYPLFANLKYGSPKPPTYLYPALGWTKIFGHSTSSYRAFTAFITVLVIVALFFLSLRLFSLEAGIWIALIASLSPTSFQISRVALEPMLAPLFIVLAWRAFLSRRNITGGLMSGVMFALAMYSYPPARLYVPIFISMLVVGEWVQGRRSWIRLALLVLSLVVTNIPLVQGTLSGEYMGRFDKIGIFSEKYLLEQGLEKKTGDIAFVFWRNFLSHFSPEYLLVSGDKNLVYSTAKFGLLGWPESVAFILSILIAAIYLAIVVRKREWPNLKVCVLIGLLIFSVLLAVVPAALTWQDIPHSLRMILYWPFFAILVGWGITTINARQPWVGVLFLAVCFLFCNRYFKHYFEVYPKQAYYMFNGFTQDEAMAAKTGKDWLNFVYRYRRQDYHARYYLMNYREGETCSSSQRLWREVHKIP